MLFAEFSFIFLSIHLAHSPHHKLMSCRKKEGESLSGLTFGPQGKELPVMLRQCHRCSVCSHVLYVRETYLQHLRKTEKASLMIEHQDDNLLAFQTTFQFSLFLFALRREKKREL